MAKGFKDSDGKFRPTEKQSSGISSKSVIGDNEPTNISVDNTQLMQQKQSEDIDINKRNFSFELDKKQNTIKLSLGNLTDAGWFWDGDQTDIHTFLFRMIHSKGQFEMFEKDLEEQGGSFETLKPFLRNTVNDESLYAITGDNARWHFGEDFEEGEMSNELSALGITEEQKEKVEDQAWTEYKGVDYDDFIKKFGKLYVEALQKTVNDSNSFSDYEDGVNQIKEDATQDYFGEIGNAVANAVFDSMEKLGIKSE